MDSRTMIDSQVVVASIAAAGSVGAAGVAILRTVWNRMSDRADVTDERIVNLSVELIDCHKLHSDASERIGNLEGWRQGFDEATAKQTTADDSDNLKK